MCFYAFLHVLDLIRIGGQAPSIKKKTVGLATLHVLPRILNISRVELPYDTDMRINTINIGSKMFLQAYCTYNFKVRMGPLSETLGEMLVARRC